MNKLPKIKNIPPINFNPNAPALHGQGLTDYETLTKLVAKINECIDKINEQPQPQPQPTVEGVKSISGNTQKLPIDADGNVEIIDDGHGDTKRPFSGYKVNQQIALAIADVDELIGTVPSEVSE